MGGITPKTLSLISRIYDAGLSSTRWPDILDELTGHQSAMGGVLFFDDSRHPELNDLIATSSSFWNPKQLEHYLTHVAQDDPAAVLLQGTKAGQVITSESISLEQQKRIAPFREKLRRYYGIHAVAAARLNENGSWFDFLTLQYSDTHGPMNKAEIVCFGHLIPHIAKAIEISRPLTLLEKRFRAVLDALDHFHVGMMILTQSGNKVVDNRAAKKILDQNDGLSLNANDTLTSSDPEAQGKLSRAIKHVSDTANAEGTTNSVLLGIPRRSGQDAFLTEVVPLKDTKREIGNGFNGCMVFMIDPMDTRHVSTKGMKELYRLSDAEAETCRLLVEGKTNPQIADIRGVTPETVKSQVQSMLQKTSTANRSALIKLAMSVNLPIDLPEPN